MSCTQKQQLVCFPKVRVYKPWFRHFNDHKDFRNEGTVHLFSLMALFSYANFRSNERVINDDRYMEAPGQWICKLGALPRILRVHSKTQALELMEYFQNHGFLTFEILDEEKEILRFTIADWKEHCTHLQYNYYSYTMRVQVLGTVSNGYQIINRADVGGQYLNEWQTAKATWVTTVCRFNNNPLPKTGY